MSATLSPPQTTAWQHQANALQFVQGKAAAMLAMDMGTGKSRVVVDLVRERGYQRVLILCPLSVVPVWPQQFATHWGPMAATVVALNDGAVADKKYRADLSLRSNVSPTVIVINYESAWRQPFAAWVIGQTWDLIVLDESHRVKKPGGKASWFCKMLGRRTDQRLCLTGTPMPHSPLDIYAQYRFLNPYVFGTSFTRFKLRYAIPDPRFPGRVVGYRNEDELQAKYQSIAFRVRAADVLDLPPVQHIERVVALEPAARRVYQDLERRFYAEVDAGTVTPANALVKLLRLQQVTGGFVRDDDGTDHDVGHEKAGVLTDLLDDLDSSEPVVVFGRFRHDLDTVHRVAMALDRRSAELSGRRNELADWQAGDAPILAVQIQSGGVGIDLTRAHYCVYLSLGFSLGDYEQSLARVHRPGQTRPTFYYHILAERTVDAKVYQALRARKDVVSAILEAPRDRHD